MYDTLELRNNLIKAGFKEEQAEGLVKGLSEHVMKNIATKDDLDRLGDKLTLRFGTMMMLGVSILTAVIKLL